MAAKTKADLSTAVLRRLRILAAGETASAEDAALVEDEYDDTLEALREEGLVYWPNTGRSTAEIPQVVFQALVGIMCDAVASAFGVQTPIEQEDVAGERTTTGVAGKRFLRLHISKRSSGEPTRAVYY